MMRRIAITTESSPLALKYSDIRSYILIALFVMLNVAVPWVFHQFHLAGATYLPMHLLILISGLAFGWRVGVIVGLLTPLASYAVSGMPVLPILPQVMVELSAYGLLAGILLEKFSLRMIWSLLGAMVAGRLVLFLAALVVYVAAGEVYSPLGLEASPSLAVWSVIKQGWPGIVIQLTSIPIIIWLAGRLAEKTSQSR